MREAGRGSNLSVTAHLLTVESRRGGGDAAGLTRTVPAVTRFAAAAAEERAAVVARLIASTRARCPGRCVAGQLVNCTEQCKPEPSLAL